MNSYIEKLIEEQELQAALKAIDDYELTNNGDSDIYTYKFLCNLGIGNNELALEFAKKAVKEQPYVADVHYNCAYAYEVNNYNYEAYEQYIIASEIITAGNESNVLLEDVLENANRLLNSILDNAEKTNIDQEQHRMLDYIVNKNKFMFGVRYPEFHAGASLIATEYIDYAMLDKMYVGFTGLRSSYNFFVQDLKQDTLNNKAEMQRTGSAIKSKDIVSDYECYVPIIMERVGDINFSMDEIGKNALVHNDSPYQYINYRIPKGKTKIFSDSTFRMGEIIPICHNEKRKRLVLNIFVDGLSETVLGENMMELMPYSYRFFEKGIKCTNVHTAGDWTFPSIASITTGQTLPHHKMLHSKILRRIDEDTPILFEYFKKAGYNTTKIGGNWRIAPNYGYARGMNRVKYQHMYSGYPVEQVVADVEEQMHCMRDTDQFIWMEIGELHLIADEINIAPLQSEVMVWENESFSGKINSVKQEYDETKIKYYKKQIEYIDRRLASLYQYIEENYKDEDIVVSLFADHGQGYLVKPDEKFLCDERSKIAFMFRGSEISGETDEVISACDYSGIMCKLAGINYNYSKTDACLPVAFGGSKEREFCVVESIHVGDPYRILLNGKNFKFYLKGSENVNSECRVLLDEYETLLLDKDGNQIFDDERINYYTNWCLDHISSCRIINK